MTKLRLLKLVATPVFVLDDGENLREEVGKQIVITPDALPGFAERFMADVVTAQEALDKAEAGETG